MAELSWDAVLTALKNAVTVAPALLRASICSPLVQGAVAAFEEDFTLYHSEGLLKALQA